MDDCESLERATLAAVPPEAQEEAAGWLLAFDRGTVGRAHSAAPLRHAAAVADRSDEVVRRYRDRGFRPVLRLPDHAAFEPLQARLEGPGFAPGKTTMVQTAQSPLWASTFRRRCSGNAPHVAHVSISARSALSTSRSSSVCVAARSTPGSGRTTMAANCS